MLVDYHVHTLGHGEFENTLEEVYPFFREAAKQGLCQIGIADHTQLASKRAVSVLRQANSYFPEVELRLGFELDLSKDSKKQLDAIMAMPDIDYLIGSVHYIGDWLFNDEAFAQEFEKRDIDTVYEQYYNLVKAAALTGLFDIVGHFDLIKLFNVGLSKKSIMYYAEPVLKAIKDADLCVEINTSGLQKPVAEVFPSKQILEKCYEYGIPVTFGSDAHFAVDVGRDISLARQLAKQIGYRRLATFTKRRRIMVVF